MVEMMTVKQEEVLACRICLAADMQLYNIRENKLEDTLTTLMGTTFSARDGFPQHVCAYCRALLVKCSALRARCHRAQLLLKEACEKHFVIKDHLQSIDRVAEKLSLNLKICNIYSSDSTQQDPVKIEDIKEENDFMENIFVGESTVDFDDSISEANETEINDDIIADDTNLEKNAIRNKSIVINKQKNTRDKSKEPKTKVKSIRKRKTIETNKETKRKLTNTSERSKRIIKRRMADNGFLPDFNFDEFQTKYNVKIDILSKEEQLREIEAKKMAPSYTLAAFGCEICGKGFATKQVYDVHMMKHTASAGAHACEVCGVRFLTRSRAHVHADAHRLRFTCERCAFVTRTRFIAKNHFLSHAGTTHQCPHCEAVFNKYTSYLTHVRRRHPAMNVACDECGETFVGHNGLRHHKTRVHRNRKLPKTPQYKCSSCSAHFVSAEALDRHTDSAPENSCDDSLRPCAQCGESQFSEERLTRHIQERHAPRPHLCRECNKSFVDARSFDTHYARVHLNIRLKEPPRAKRPSRAFICEQCGNECTSLTNLVSHQRSHSGVKPHACPACALRFSSLHNMQRHHRVVHLGQRPQVKCSMCGKLLAHASSLKLHVNTVHLKMPLPPRQRRRRDDDK